MYNNHAKISTMILTCLIFILFVEVKLCLQFWMFVFQNSVKHTCSQSQTDRAGTGTMKLNVPENIGGITSYLFGEKNNIVVQTLSWAYGHYCGHHQGIRRKGIAQLPLSLIPFVFSSMCYSSIMDSFWKFLTIMQFFLMFHFYACFSWCHNYLSLLFLCFF